MGETDLLKRVMGEMGFETDFWRLKMRPGTPFSFGFLPVGPTARPLPVFGLPGNPASAFVTFQVLVRPFILALAGHRDMHRRVVHAWAAESLTAATDVAHFFRVRLEESDSGLVAHLTGPQGSGLVRSLGEADGLALVPVGVETIAAGEAVRVMLLRQGNATGIGSGI
jgi:molybdopterin molybdotransferase